jgi:FlaA1/EpsC-like NDP-sugar epimerase
MEVAVAGRYDWHPTAATLLAGLGTGLLAGVVQGAIGSPAHLYRRRYRLGSAQEAVLLAGVVAVTGAVISVINVLAPVPPVPRSVPAMAAVATLVLAAGLRLAVRARRDALVRPDPTSALRVIVYGAGRTGAQLVRSMMEDTDGGLRPVAMLDDDHDRRQQRICGVPVLGAGADVVAIARRTRADLLVIAMRKHDLEPVRAASRAVEEVGVRVKVLPPLGERLKPVVGVADLREIDINDLLGRQPVETDVAIVSPSLTDRRVLVTGAGGSIGSELCRQIARFGPAELLMLDRDESALHGVQLSIYGRALLDSPDVILADIRDAEALDAVFASRRPHIVFHAAALKHLPMLEQYPGEAWKTNVQGTVNVLAAATAHGVERLVNISTDKAADPTSVLGQSKRVGERLVAGMADETGLTCLSVRFGNVLGSRGSVVTTFVEQLASGAPVTVTHPEVSRFFMTVREAVQLVLQAGALGRPGRVHVLDMGAQVRIVDLAHQLMRTIGIHAPLVYTGLRKGEKLHEDLFGKNETEHEMCHPAIAAVEVPGLSQGAVEAAGLRSEPAWALIELCSSRDGSTTERLAPVPAVARGSATPSAFLERAARPIPAQP